MLKGMIRVTPDQWAYIQHYISCQVKRCKIRRKDSLAGKRGLGEEAEKHEGVEVKGGGADPLPDACDGGGCEEGETWSDLK